MFVFEENVSRIYYTFSLCADGFTVFNCFYISRIYTERQKSCIPILIFILFQTEAFENKELSMNRQVISNKVYASAVILSSTLRRHSQKC